MKTAVLFLSAVLALPAQTPDKAVRGKQLLQEAVGALGGQKFLSVKDRLETGRAYSFYRDQLSGLAQARIYTKYYDNAPAGEIAQRERQAFGKDEDALVLFLPTDGYQITYRGAKPIQNQRFERYLNSTRRNIFYILRMRLNEPGLIVEHQGSTVWSNTPVEILDITDADNNVVTVYLHRTTKLPVRQSSLRRDPKTRERNEEVSIYSKYRDVGDGVQWPFSIMAQRNGEKVFELYSESVAVNQSLSESLFTLPSEMKVLPKEKDPTY